MRISELWDERGIIYDKENLHELISVPDNAQYYAALGSVIFGEGESNNETFYEGIASLHELVNHFV